LKRILWETLAGGNGHRSWHATGGEETDCKFAMPMGKPSKAKLGMTKMGRDRRGGPGANQTERHFFGKKRSEGIEKVARSSPPKNRLDWKGVEGRREREKGMG